MYDDAAGPGYGQRDYGEGAEGPHQHPHKTYDDKHQSQEMYIFRAVPVTEITKLGFTSPTVSASSQGRAADAPVVTAYT
jgi:hypothetical protein